jgi:DNA polymerase-1
VLVAVDFGGQEICGLAEVSFEPALIAAIYKGIDIHLMMANEIEELGIPDDALITTHPQYESYKVKFKKQRDKTKTVNFGLAYGKTAYGFATDWNISVDDAQAFIDRYFARYPLVKKAIEKCRRDLEKNKWAATVCGRRRRWYKVNKSAYREAFNHTIQGRGADQTKAAGVALRKLLLSHPEWEAAILLQVHDELVLEINEEYADAAMPQVAETVVRATPWKAIVPYSASVSKGHSYSECK